MTPYEETVCGYDITVYETAPGASVCAVLPVARTEDGAAAAVVLRSDGIACVLCAVRVRWNADLSPWAADAVMRDSDAFDGGGETFLAALTTAVLPAVSARYPAVAQFVLCGYSLAGLFALWAMTHTACFSGIASMSGSLWYEGFAAHLAAWAETGAVPVGYPVYLSVGTKEHRVRHPILSSIRRVTEDCAACLTDTGCRVTLEFPPGNHFSDVPVRTARGIAAVVRAVISSDMKSNAGGN